ncbi:hypothetical protein [Robiginitalea biformata]|uniref:Uncharacterized protein n=1 Tax=Robiginitalea biformata (strain ATCC BAA-864 / DSM 15991 / KCTC 12146 / HTCC2501) TaxID=313596 RepID=A4CM23_ROBBH|nr:hypothetical protein [Robiginitalea biformata]EAR14715.1 hypothetical protein RB2501_10332 [Robiginitalea biformata HTCC2501]
MGTLFIEGSITGHASPKWKHPGRKDKKILNRQLSVKRAEEVERFVQEIFRRELQANGLDIHFAMECTREKDFDAIAIASEGVGDMQTILEVDGDPDANDPSLRRVDINLILTHQMEGETGMSVLITIPEECEDQATDRWAIKLAMSGGAGHAGAGGAFAIGQLKNRKTGQIVQGSFVGGGAGFGLQSPGADPGWGDWTNFRTDQRITFQHFDGTLARLTTAGGGFLIGYSLAYISFPIYGANSISVGGFNLGSIGADIGTNIGQWNITGGIPGPRCIPEHEIPGEEAIPFSYQVEDNLTHRVFFDTGSADISNEQLSFLEGFIRHAAGEFMVNQ